MMLLNRVGEIWYERKANPEVFNDQDSEEVKYSSVAMRKDTILQRRSSEVTGVGAPAGQTRGIIYIQDSRLQYPTTFNEQMWIVLDGVRWNIVTIHEADDFSSMHHYEVEVVQARNR